MIHFFKIYIIINVVLLLNYSLLAQVSIPINDKEMQNFKAENERILSMKIDISQTYLYTVKENIISKKKYLIHEVLYNERGLPEKTIFYDEDQHVLGFVKFNYNANNLPFEEISFNADSSLIGGLMYEYDSSGFLKKQTNYNMDSGLISEHKYQRFQDSIVVDAFANGILLYQYIMLFNNDVDDNLIACYKKNVIDKEFEKTHCNFIHLSSLRRNIILNNDLNDSFRDYFYNDDGILIRTLIYTKDRNLISDFSFEYDDFGNVIRIIEIDADKQINVYVTNYFNLKQ